MPGVDVVSPAPDPATPDATTPDVPTPAATAPAPVVEAAGVAFRHPGGPPVLTGVDLAVHPGARTAVLGANGSGKTTLFRLLAGALVPTAGELRLDGAPVSRRRSGLTRLRTRVQLVLQEPDDQLFAPSVAQDVSFGPVNLGLAEAEVRERVAAALTATGTTHLADRAPHLLSYGERKRVGLAGALAMAPGLLVLDEPTAGLDPAGVALLLGTLAALHAAGTAVLLSTHDVDLAHAWAQDVAVVHEGRLRTGPAEEVLADRALLTAARLTLPWGPQVDRALGTRVRSAAELAAVLDAREAGPPAG